MWIQLCLVLLNYQQFYLFGRIQISQTGGKLYIDTSPNGECTLPMLKLSIDNCWVSVASLLSNRLALCLVVFFILSEHICFIVTCEHSTVWHYEAIFVLSWWHCFPNGAQINGDFRAILKNSHFKLKLLLILNGHFSKTFLAHCHSDLRYL